MSSGNKNTIKYIQFRLSNDVGPSVKCWQTRFSFKNVTEE